MGAPAGKPGATAPIKQLATRIPSSPGKTGTPTSSQETGMMRGTVVWFSEQRGYGFLRAEGVDAGAGQDVFVHYTSIISNSKRKNLFQNQRVEFEVGDDGKGRYAFNVQVVT